MYKDVMRAMAGAEFFPVIAIIIFTLFFAGLIVYVVRMKKKDVAKLSSLPLEDTFASFPTVIPNGKA